MLKLGLYRESACGIGFPPALSLAAQKSGVPLNVRYFGTNLMQGGRTSVDYHY